MSSAGGDERDDKLLPSNPDFPEYLIHLLKEKLDKKEAPFLKYLGKNLTLVWIDENDSRLGMTRFEYSANELFRRRKLRLSCGPVTIGLNPMLNRDLALYKHTLSHELLHPFSIYFFLVEKYYF